jgi:iron complex outermembrane recepter protein
MKMTYMSDIRARARAKWCLLAGSGIVSVVAFCTPGTAIAQDSAPAKAMAAPTEVDARSENASEILVTGSRIIRNGYQAPTPVTVLGAADLALAGTITIGEAVNRLPQLQSASTSRTPQLSQGLTGVNLFNLRGLGSNRNLVLVDGQRFAASALTGVSDSNTIPQGLVKRVDIVTGGASAAYGSDALSGVINFVLDHEFTGIKMDAGSSITTYGDDVSAKFNLTAGTSFADGRGHLEAYGEFAYVEGITGRPRPWQKENPAFLLNPAYTATNGLPRYIHGVQLGLATAAPGGVITSGVLKGVAFGNGGSPFQLNYGPTVSGNVMLGGDWNYTRIDQYANLDNPLKSGTGFGRASYDLSDSITAYVQAQYTYVLSYNKQNVSPFFLGNLTINAANPYLPATVANQLAATGGSASFGTTLQDVGPLRLRAERRFQRYSAGIDGQINTLGTAWTWNAYYQYSSTDISIDAYNNVIPVRLRQAINAVVDPATGAIVCADRSNGCVPFNVIGTGVNSQRSIDFVTDDDWSRQTLSQHSAGVSLNGEPFSTWAGPISLALGAEWRREAVSGQVSPLAAANAFLLANFKATNAHYDVKEAFVEAVVPIARDAKWARSFDLNAAARVTDYSTSGRVVTWKLGATYKPVDDLMFRVTRSRDIRAPNLGDLFAQSPQTQNSFTDPQKGGSAYTVALQTTGNPNLKPEVASTLGAGLVLSPRFLPGFGASFDFYRINIGKAIQTLAAQSIINRCASGIQVFCSLVDRDANGFITLVRQSPANFLTQKATGFDIEASYRLPLSDIGFNSQGGINFRVLANHTITLKTVDINSTIEGAGVNSYFGITQAVNPIAPKWRVTPSITYSDDLLTMGVTMRYISPGKFLNEAVECTTNCPTSTGARPTVDLNHIPGWAAIDLAVSYRVKKNIEAYFNIDNVANKGPGYHIADAAGAFYSGVSFWPSFYDVLGRVFRGGVRIKL